MRGALILIAALAVLGALAGAAVVGLGLYNVSARAGHLPGVSWVLHTTFRNSVRLRAMPLSEVPDLSDPALAELGARHYATACATCHAMPGADRTATMKAMVPVPPPIDEAVGEWKANHLHWIVLNGIKMSGMPAWPAPDREAEVWPVVAYLLAVQRGEAPAPDPDESYCAGCHGGVARHVPRLDIQNRAYLERALAGYRDGSRASGIMEQAVSMVPAGQLAGLAAYFAAQEVAAGDRAPAEGPGEELARQGTRDVPACTACHGPGADRAREDHPALAGQDRAYLAAQLRLWRDGRRGGSPVMTAAAQDLTDAEIAALADWYAALPAVKGPAGD